MLVKVSAWEDISDTYFVAVEQGEEILNSIYKRRLNVYHFIVFLSLTLQFRQHC